LGEEDKPLDFADGDLFARVVVGEFGDAELVRLADRDRGSRFWAASWARFDSRASDEGRADGGRRSAGRAGQSRRRHR